MAVSWHAFRDRFPTASLDSVLLAIHNDQFVVKVTIQTDTLGMAVGLAAQATVEMAEDQALHRALQRLGWEPLPDLVAAPELPVAPVSLAVTPAKAVPDVPLASPSERPAPAVAAAETAIAPPPPPKAPTLPSANGRAKLPAPPVAPPPAPEAPPAVVPGIDATVTATAAMLPAPINLSDVIAQTDIELRRLGWSVETGREYLEKTYDKRSRHELSEEELIQFLCHLESLSTPPVTSE